MFRILVSLMRRKTIILTAAALLGVSGFAGYEAWHAHKQEQATIDMITAPGCNICSHLKQDLAEKVRLREQQSGQADGSLPVSP